MKTMIGSCSGYPVPRFLCLLAASLVVAGCGGNLANNKVSPPIEPGPELNGKLMGGQFPVRGSSVQLYAAGASGYGTGATALLSPAKTTDQNGYFSIASSDYTCPTPGTPTYLVATGGDPGLGSNNPAIALMAALGPCSGLSSLSFVNMNEVTTIASVWSLSQFLGQGAQIGTSPSNAVGLANAFANVNNLVDVTTGASPGAAAPASAVLPVAKIYTLANILASCINSLPSTACNALFNAAASPSGPIPNDTVGAALDIARNPSNNVAGLFALAIPQSPFQPSISAAPNDWTIAVTFNGGGLSLPASIAIDAVGNAWAANYCGSSNPCSSVTELSATGNALSTSSGFANSTLWESYGLALDPSGNAWVTNQQTAGVNSGHGSIGELNASGQVVAGSPFYLGGVYFPVALAADTDGSIWTANQGNSTVSKLSNTGSPISGGAGWGSGHFSGPSAVAIDANHDAWFANTNASSGSVTSVSQDGSTVNEITSGGDQPVGIATDQVGISTNTSKGHVWVANYATSSVSELRINNDGTVTVVSTGYTGGGISHPNGIAVDGIGRVWVANWVGNSLSELQGANDSNPGQPVSPASGFGADADLHHPYGIAFDSSGNIWVSNFASSTITQFLGAAAPVRAPLVGPPQLP